MATFAFKPYTYVPTAPRSKSTATRRRPAPEQVSIFDKLQHIMSSSESPSTPQPAAAPASDDGGYRPGIRGAGTVYGGSDKANNDETDDDQDLPTIEELLFTNLQAQGFTTGDRGPGKTSGVEEAAVDERGASVDRSRSAQSDDSGGSPEDPICLLGDDDSSASAAEADNVGLGAKSTELDAGLSNGQENTLHSTTSTPTCSSDGWHDIDDFPETAPRLQLAEQGASTPDSLPPHTPSSRLSSAPLHDSISTDSTATSPSSSPSSRHCRASPAIQLSQEGRLHTGRGVTDEHELVDQALDTLLIDEGARKQQEVEQEQDEGNSEEKDEGPQQEMDLVAPVVTAERADGGPKPVNRRQSLLDPASEPSHNEAGRRCDNDSDDELNSSNSAGDDEEEPRPAKRKQPSLSHGGPARKKRRRPLLQSPPRQRRPLSKPHREYPKSHSPLNQRSRLATSSSAEGRLPSPAPSMPQSIDTTMPPNDSSLGRSSRASPPTLTEITFRPHSAHCYSFTAVVRDGCDGRGVSLAQVVRLIASTGHVGKIDDFTIKPMEQHSYLLSGFSWHASSPFSSGTILSPTVEANCVSDNAPSTTLQQSKVVGARTLLSEESEPLSSDDETGLSDSDPNLSSDDDACLSKKKQGSSTRKRKNRRWSDLEEARLRAYKKEGKDWSWISRKFPGRTSSGITQHWKIMTRAGD